MAQSDVASPIEETPSEDTLRRQAYSAATTRLRNAHRSDFDGYVTEEMAKRGIDWQPRLSEEQKAEKQMAELLAAHPGLRAKFTAPADAPSEG